MLDETQIEALRAKYGKIGTVDFEKHQLVFRRPSRESVRDYRRKVDSPAEKPDALDQLAQATIIAFDGDQDTTKARQLFLLFLEDYPLFTGSNKAMTVFNILTGITEQEDDQDLGKGVSVRSSPPKISATV